MNLSKQYLKRLCSLALCASITVSATSQALSDKNKLPDIGTIASSALSIEKEKMLGDIMRRQLRAQAPLVYDPLLDEYISALGNKLVSNASDVRYPFHFYVLKANTINAFATFGGTIAIHTQTIIESQTESELASVVAHEIAHITQRHIARKMEMTERMAPANIATLVGAVLVTLISPSAAVPALMTATGAQQQMQINYTRHHEKEADRIGLQTLVQANYDPKGAEDFFGRMAEKTRYSTKLPPMLYSHPLPESRMADIKARVDTIQHRIYPASTEYQFIRTRTLVRHSQNAEHHAEYFKNKLAHANQQDKQIYMYGQALALVDLKQYNEAIKIIDKLLSYDANNLHFVDVMTDAMIGLKQFDKLYQKLEKYRQQRPTNQVVILNYANALNMGKQYDKAVNLLKDFLLVYPNHHLAWQLIVDAYEGAEYKSQYHQAKAEVFAQRLGYQQAIDELHTAHNNTPKANTADRKRISARIKQFREEIEKLNKL